MEKPSKNSVQDFCSDLPLSSVKLIQKKLEHRNSIILPGHIQQRTIVYCLVLYLAMCILHHVYSPMFHRPEI